MGGKSSRQTQTNRVDIPDFLQPFLHQSAGAASGSLQSLQRLTQNPMVANFNPVQTEAMRLAMQRARGDGDFFSTAQDAFMQTAQGQDISTFLPQMALAEFGNAINGESLPGIPQQVMNGLSAAAQGQSLPSSTLEALNRTASGDFLYGGDGFDQAVQAAVRAAQPGVLSTFGSAGVGGGTGGLAHAAIGQAATDAFARQYAQERQNQLSAANALGNFGLAGQQQQLGALGQLAGISQAQQGLGLSQQGLGLSAANSLAGFADAERVRQLQAAGTLPSLATADINLLSGVGQRMQDHEQQRINAPIAAQQALLQSALGGAGAFSPLFGSTQTQTARANPMSQILGGALTGLSLFGSGGLFPNALGGLFGGGGGALTSGLSGGVLTPGQLMATNNPLTFFTSPLGGY